MIGIERNADESLFEYHKRLVYGKTVTGDLSEIDYAEFSEPLYGKPYSSETARRMMAGSRATLEALESSCTPGCVVGCCTNSVDENSDKIEAQRLFDQRRELNKILREESRYGYILERMASSAERLSESVGVMFSPENIVSNTSVADEATEAVLFLSDWHYGMTTNNIFNTYNTKVCRERASVVTEAAMKRLRLHECKRLHVVILGDMCHGAIHASARVASEELVCDQLMQVSEMLAQCIEAVSSCVEETFVYVTYGNHMRTVQKSKDSIHDDNMERIIPWWLKQRLKCTESVHIVPETGTEFLFVETMGHNICATHGDLDSLKDTPRLFSAVANRRCGKSIDYIVIGDKHHSESFDELGVTAQICGSLCGTDEYANGKRMYSDPMQLLLIVNEDGVDAEYKLKV